MSSGGTADRGEHRGLVYRGHGHLLVCTVAVVRAALDQGHRVVVGLDRPAGRALDAALGDVLDRPGTIAWAAPGAAPHHESAAFAERLRSLVPPTGRLLVLEQYSTDGSGRRPSPELDRVLSSSPITLLCACPISSDPDVLRAFGDGHTLSASFLPGGRTGRGRPGPPVDRAPVSAPSPGVYETTLHGAGDLRELRDRLRRIAAGAGFTSAARDRAVLAVHEAAALACRSVGRAGGPTVTDRATAASACTLRLHTWPHRMEVEIDLPRSARFPADLRDADPLCHIRTFCREASWIGTLHPRRIRVVAQHEP